MKGSVAFTMVTKQDKKNENINNFKIIKDGTITSVPGFYASACHCGIKKSKKFDICTIYAPEGSTCSGVFTTNKFPAAPVLVTGEQLKKAGNIKAIIVNSGIANACTGKIGYINAKKTIDIASKYLNTGSESIIVSSTGVIGKHLPMGKIEHGIKECCSDKLSSKGGHDAAEAILTTDLKTKEIAVCISVKGGQDIIIGGIAKGSGMIEPNMATLLVFITTNIGISKDLLDKILHEETDKSFNSITVDGCQSTNDMVVVMTNAQSSIYIKNKNDKYYDDFKNAFSYVMKDLAKKIVLDGEGATKLIKIKVINAKDTADARKLAFKVANSNLFKCAMFGQDLNWGRINAALGSADCDFNPDKINICIGNILIVENGMGVEFNTAEVKNLMKEREIRFTINLNCGSKDFEVLTADLSFDYIKINALYRT